MTIETDVDDYSNEIPQSRNRQEYESAKNDIRTKIQELDNKWKNKINNIQESKQNVWKKIKSKIRKCLKHKHLHNESGDKIHGDRQKADELASNF